MDHADVFKALGDGTRLRILKLICEAGESACVCEVVDALALPQYLVSKHLTVLRRAGLVEDERLGTWVGYQLPADASPFHQAIFALVQTAVTGPQFDRDRVRLRARVALREEGRCVIGYNDPQVSASLESAERLEGLPGKAQGKGRKSTGGKENGTDSHTP